MRLLGPAICLAVAATSALSVCSGSDDVIVFVGIDRLVGIDPVRQAGATTLLFGSLGSVWGLWALRSAPQAEADASLDE
jgi:hypothetical protein